MKKSRERTVTMEILNDNGSVVVRLSARAGGAIYHVPDGAFADLQPGAYTITFREELVVKKVPA